MDHYSIFLKLFCSLLLFPISHSCIPAELAPDNSPFIQPQRGFALSCNHHNQTTIHFHGNIDLLVRAISYNTRRLTLRDPHNCVHRVFLNLNLSLTPFSYSHVVRDYKYLNCSGKLGGIEAVPCLSGSGHHVYVVEPSFLEPLSCSAVKTVAIPFSYSRYISDGSFGLGLTWPSTLGEAEYDHKGLYALLSTMIVVLFIVGKLLYAKYGAQEKVEEILGEKESHNLMGEYEALKL